MVIFKGCCLLLETLLNYDFHYTCTCPLTSAIKKITQTLLGGNTMHQAQKKVSVKAINSDLYAEFFFKDSLYNQMTSL